VWNLVIMSTLWTVTTFNYTVVFFYIKYIPGNLYVNITIGSIAELVAYFSSGLLLNLLKPKLSFILAYLTASLGGLSMLFLPPAGWL
jgi:uncharacterized protein YybS (DUF2232 family)